MARRLVPPGTAHISSGDAGIGHPARSTSAVARAFPRTAAEPQFTEAAGVLQVAVEGHHEDEPAAFVYWSRRDSLWQRTLKKCLVAITRGALRFGSGHRCFEKRCALTRMAVALAATLSILPPHLLGLDGFVMLAAERIVVELVPLVETTAAQASCRECSARAESNSPPG